MFYDSPWFEQCSSYLENLSKIHKRLSFSEINSLATLPNSNKSVLLLCTCKAITQFNRVCVIVVLRLVLILQSAENVLSLEVFVAGISRRSLINVTTSENIPSICFES